MFLDFCLILMFCGPPQKEQAHRSTEVICIRSGLYSWV